MSGILFLCLGYVMSQFYRSFLAVMAPTLQDELAMSASDLSLASGAWFITFALMQFPIGAWLDRTGPRMTSFWLLLIGGGGGSVLFALATQGWMVILAMGLIGVGCSPVLMASFFVFAKSFSAARFAVLSSSFIGVGTLGNIFGSSPLALAIEAFGWRTVSWGLAGITIAIALAVFFTLKDPEIDRVESKKGSFLDLLKIRALWPILPLVTLGYAVAAGIRGLWVGPYVQDMFNMGTAEIGQVTLYMAIALSVGSFAYGPMDTLFRSRKWVALVGNGFVAAALAWLVFQSGQTVFGVTVAFFIIGFFGANYAVLMAHGKAFFPAHLTGRGVTLLNFFAIGGVGLFQVISGRVVTHFKTEGIAASGYHELFVMYLVVLLITMVIYLFSRDVKPGTESV